MESSFIQVNIEFIMKLSLSVIYIYIFFLKFLTGYFTYLCEKNFFQCDAVDAERTYFLPIKSHYLLQISETLGLENY